MVEKEDSKPNRRRYKKSVSHEGLCLDPESIEMKVIVD